MRLLALLIALAPCLAIAAPAPKSKTSETKTPETKTPETKTPANAEDFARLPALGKFVEGGTEKDQRFRTYLVGKKPTSTGAISIFVGEIHMRVQDIAPSPRPPQIKKWRYAARCSGAANTIGVMTWPLVPRDAMMEYQVMPGVEPELIDRTWYNVWYAVCLDDFDKYPRKQEQ
jgi:hypothetical protein